MGFGSVVNLFLGKQFIRERVEIDTRREESHLPKAGSHVTAQIRRSCVSIIKDMVNNDYG